jgi:NADH dehydrogenase
VTFFLLFLIYSLVGRVVGDVTITHDETEGLMAGLLYTGSPPVGRTKLTEWAREYATTLGMHYANELARRKNRTEAYEQL